MKEFHVFHEKREGKSCCGLSTIKREILKKALPQNRLLFFSLPSKHGKSFADIQQFIISSQENLLRRRSLEAETLAAARVSSRVKAAEITKSDHRLWRFSCWLIKFAINCEIFKKRMKFLLTILLRDRCDNRRGELKFQMNATQRFSAENF